MTKKDLAKELARLINYHERQKEVGKHIDVNDGIYYTIGWLQSAFNIDDNEIENLKRNY